MATLTIFQGLPSRLATTNIHTAPTKAATAPSKWLQALNRSP